MSVCVRARACTCVHASVNSVWAGAGRMYGAGEGGCGNSSDDVVVSPNTSTTLNFVEH